jgi:phosphoribosylanthranilate isomerase
VEDQERNAIGTRVKICGLTRREDALMAASAGAHYLGVVLVPGSPRAREAEEARAVLDKLPASSVIVVADRSVKELVRAAEVVEPSVIQLHGDEDPTTVSSVAAAGPWRVWKAIRVKTPEDVARGRDRYAGVARGLVLDGWDPERLGGTGAAFEWDRVAGLLDGWPPDAELVVAGGLRPENVRRAVAILRPHVVDVSSGVEREPGVKDRLRVESFMESVRSPGGPEGRNPG